MIDKGFRSLLLIVLALVAAGLACESSSDDSQGVRTLVEPASEDQKQDGEGSEYLEISATDTPAPTPTQEIEGLVKVGTHLVGTDIEPGIYVGLAGEGMLDSCYWARLSNLTGSDDILANDNAKGLFYVEILSDDRAFETRCKLLPISQVPARDEFITVLPPGIYIVGRDIQPGTYRGEAGDNILDSCYWARLSNVSGEDNILANDNAMGQFFIEVLPADFALQVGCEVEML